MKRVLFSLFVLTPLFLPAQKTNFSLTIHFKLIVPAKYVYIFMNYERRIDTLPFPINDILNYKGVINNPGTFQIKTDSSAPISLWIDSTPIFLSCSEEKTKYGYTQLNINSLQGSDDSKLYFQMTVPRSFTKKLPLNLTKEERDSISKSDRFHFGYDLVDSLFNIRPTSPILPFYISFYQTLLEADAVSSFFQRLTDESQNSEQGQKIKLFLERSALLQKGTVVENFIMKNFKGRKLSLHSVSAKYILLDFWASWCGPCRAENPNLVKVYNQYKEKGFEIIGISLDDTKRDWIKAVKKDNLTWHHISDLKGWENKLAQKYKISYVPYTILLDSNYRVIATSLHASQLEDFLARLYK